MKKLAVINYQAIRLYYSQGWSKERLNKYYNPNNIFDEVRIYAFQEPNVFISDKDGWHISDNVHVYPFHEFEAPSQQIEAFQPDVIRCYECNQPFASFALKISEKLGIPSYLSLHDSRKRPNVYLKNYTVITAYNYQVSHYANSILNRPIEIQLNGIDSQFFCPQKELGIRQYHSYRILTIGRNDPVKNMNAMIMATSFFNQKKESARHILIGPGTKEMPTDLSVHEGYGHASEIKIRDYLQWSNCFFQVQLVPDIGMAHTEALMMGVPIITTGKIPEFAGIQIPLEVAQNIKQLVDVLHMFFSHNYDPKQIRKWAIKHYDIQKFQAKEVKRYRKLFS